MTTYRTICTLALDDADHTALADHLCAEIVAGRLVITADIDGITEDALGRHVPVPSEIHRALTASGVMTRWYRSRGGDSDVRLSADTAIVDRIQDHFRSLAAR